MIEIRDEISFTIEESDCLPPYGVRVFIRSLSVRTRFILCLKMNNNREKSVVDFNQSIQTSSTSKLPLQMHNFMPMPTSTLNGNHQQVIT